jgi:hypothetical protein
MSIHISPEYGVPLSEPADKLPLHTRLDAMCQTVEHLEDSGLEVVPTQEDKDVAAVIARAYAADQEKTSTSVNTIKASTLTPASLLHIRSYLDEFGRNVVHQAVELRNLVTNRLLEESQNPDPRIRIKALELLGKHSDVGLFTDRSEVTITHQTTDELRNKLREKLQKLTRTVQKVPSEGVIDVDAELGLSEKEVWVAEDAISEEIDSNHAQ